MRFLALLLSFIILTVTIPLILYFNFFGLAFNWADLLFFFAVGTFLYLLILAVGTSLNKEFNRSIDSFIKGDIKDLQPKPSLTCIFGLLLITLLPFLFYLLLIAVFAAICFFLYGFTLVSYMPRIPIAILIGLIIVVLGTIGAFFIGLFKLFFPPRHKPFGINLEKTTQFYLWKITDEVATAVGTKPVNRIIITPNSGIAVFQNASLLTSIFGVSQRVLLLGIPSLHDLTIDEFKAILAHEYGHFSNRDTLWSSFTYSMGNSLISALNATPGPVKFDEKNNGYGFVGLVMLLNPAYWILALYVWLFSRVTNAFSRIREVMADIRAMKLYGGESLKSGLLKVAINDALFSEGIESWISFKVLHQGNKLDNVATLMDWAKNYIPKDTQNDLTQQLLNRSSSPYDSHPSLSTRVQYSEQFRQSKEPLKQNVTTIFADWDPLTELVTDLMNTRLLTLHRDTKNANQLARLGINKEIEPS